MWMLIVLSLVIPSVVYAEPYVQVQAGIGQPSRLQQFEGEYWSKHRFSTSDLALDAGPAVGAKLGYFFPSAPAIGLELDALYTTPSFHRQSYWIHNHLNGHTQGAIEPSTKVWIGSVGLNLVGRYPGETWQPYLAAGPAVFAANYGGDPTNLQIGLNVEGGLRVVLWNGLFASLSYKYQRADLTFRESSGPGGCINGFNTLYQNHVTLVGLGWNF